MSAKKKKYFIFALIVSLIVMPISYAALAQVLKIGGTTNIDADWNIVITDIRVKSQNGAFDKQEPSYDNVTATFDVNLEYPGANSTYLITVENMGKINATLSEINGVDTANLENPKKIQYTVKRITSSDELDVGESQTFEVNVEWIKTDKDKFIDLENKTATIEFIYIQNQ